MQKAGIALALAIASITPTAARADGFDFGEFKEFWGRSIAFTLFGVIQPVAESSTASIDAATAEADPSRLVTLARGLRARVVGASPDLGANIDMMVPWPNAENPSHLIACNEEGADKPGVQRIRLSDGAAETILRGTVACDPVRATPWGTLIVAEENGSDGRLIEIARPLETTDVIFNRSTSSFSGGTGAENVVERPAVGRLSFEGIAVYASGVMYYGDENRPSSGTAGGAYFKFVPSNPWTGGALSDLSLSPLADGRVFGLRLGKRSGNTDYGQGTNTGLGTWIEVSPARGANLRAAAASLKLTGYYRPEDLDIDRRVEAQGSVRFCGNNTGNESADRAFGETVCITDGSLADALAGTATPELQYLVIGTPDLAMPDNIAYQPRRGNWLIQEDGDGPEVGRNNDIFACLDDGHDSDLLSDGCVRVLTVNDLNAETTGGIFDAAGRRYWVSIQHNVTGYGVVLEISGWR